MPCEQPLLFTFDHLLKFFQSKPQKNTQPFLRINQVLTLFIFTDNDKTDEDDKAHGGKDDEIEVETVLPFWDPDSEPEPEQLMRVSDFDLFSSSGEEESTSLVALALAWSRARYIISTHPALTPLMTLCPIIGQAGGGAVTGEQRCQSLGLLICQPGLEAAVEEPEPLGYPNLRPDSPRKGWKCINKKFYDWFFSKLFLVQMPP